MIQQEMLEYQSLDSELNKIERELKKNEFYVKRKQWKGALAQAEEQLARLEQKTVDLRNQLSLVSQNLQQIGKIVDEYTKEMADIEDQDELNYISKKLDLQLDALVAAEKELKQILHEGDEADKSFEKISKVQLPKIAAEYNRCGVEFDKATQAQKPRVLELKKRQTELKADIDQHLFEVYKKVSQQIHPVFVPLQNGNRCGGCRMEMPVSQVNAKIAEKGYIICEHCGRVVYKED